MTDLLKKLHDEVKHRPIEAAVRVPMVSRLVLTDSYLEREIQVDSSKYRPKIENFEAVRKEFVLDIRWASTTALNDGNTHFVHYRIRSDGSNYTECTAKIRKKLVRCGAHISYAENLEAPGFVPIPTENVSESYEVTLWKHVREPFCVIEYRSLSRSSSRYDPILIDPPLVRPVGTSDAVAVWQTLYLASTPRSASRSQDLQDAYRPIGPYSVAQDLRPGLGTVP